MQLNAESLVARLFTPLRRCCAIAVWPGLCNIVVSVTVYGQLYITRAGGSDQSTSHMAYSAVGATVIIRHLDEEGRWRSDGRR